MTARSALVGLLLAVLASIGVAAPALAANELGVSRDGVNWGGSLPGPLFDPDFRWVPGDSEQATFFVRNRSSDAGVLDITLLTGPIEDLIDTGDLRIGVRLDAGPFTTVETGGEHRLVDQVPVAAGSVHEVTVQVDFDPASPNTSQAQALDLRFDVALTQDASVSPPTNGGDNGGGVAGPGGDLPDTGTVISPFMFLLAVLLCAAGGGLIGYSRRRAHPLEERPSHAQA